MTSTPSQIPFVGLRPFDIADHRWFHGRDKEIEILLRKVCSNRFTAVVGAPGCGKSSLVRSGILTSLVKDGWKAIIAKPGSAPIAKLALALTHTTSGNTEDLLEACTYWHDTKLRQSTFALSEIADQLIPDDQRLLLVIDQFEELFSYGKEVQGIEKAAIEEEIRIFIELLLTAASQNTGRLHVMITLRSDFIENCTAYYGLAEAVNTSQYLVPLPNQDQLEEIIRKPVADSGGKMDEMLVQRLLRDAAKQTNQLPWLQHTLHRLWEVAQGEPRWLREQDYHTISGMAGSISIKAEQIATGLKKVHTENFVTLKRVIKAISTLDDKGQVIRQTLKRSALFGLVTKAMSSNKTADDSPNGVLNVYTNEEISIIQLGANDDPKVDIAHEVVIRSWQYSNEKDRQFKTGWSEKEREIGRRWWNLAHRPKIRQFNLQSLIKGSVLSLSILGAITLVAGTSIFFAQTYYNEKTHREAESQNQLQTEVLATADYAQSLIENGHARHGALIALSAIPKNRRTNGQRYVDEIGVALANALARPIEIMRRDHNSLVYSVAFSPDGSRIVSSSTDNALRLWDAKTGALIGEPMHGHDGPVNSAAFSPDGSRIVSGSWDNTLRLWDANTGMAISKPLRGHKSYVISVAFSPDGDRIISASWDKTLRLWDANTGKVIGGPLRGHDSLVYSAAFSPDGSYIVSGSEDNTLRLWDAKTGVPIGKSLHGHDSAVNSVAFSPDGSRIVSASSDKTLRLWDTNTGRTIGDPLIGHDDNVYSVTFSPNGSRLVSGSWDKTLRLWDANTGKAIGGPLRGHEGPVDSVAYAPDGSRIVSGSSDKTLRLWDANTGETIGEPLTGHNSFIYSVAYAPDNSRIVSGSEDNTLRLWDANTGKTIGEPLRGHDGPVNSAIYSPDGSRIVSGSTDKTLRLWDANTGETIGEPLHGHNSLVYSVSFSPDGNRIVSGSSDKTLRLWDAKTGSPIGEPLHGHDGMAYSAVFSPDGSRIVSGSSDKTLRLWDANTGKTIGEPLHGHDRAVNSVAFSPDGRHIVSGSSDETLRLWDANTGKAISEPLIGHNSYVISVAFSPDGSRIVSSSSDETIRLWDAKTGSPIGEPLYGHDGMVYNAMFSPDGSRIVSGSSDKTLRQWDARIFLTPLEELERMAEKLCPLSLIEHQQLLTADYPAADSMASPLTLAQRRACGE
jgi:WD40 repeat protein